MAISSPATWESAVVWLRNQPDRRQLVLDAYYDDPLPAAAKRYHQSDEWREIAALLRGRSGKALDVGFLDHVGLHGNGLAAAGGDVLHDRIRSRFAR